MMTVMTSLINFDMDKYVDDVIIYILSQTNKPEERISRNAQDMDVYHRYIPTELDTDYATLEEAMFLKYIDFLWQ